MKPQKFSSPHSFCHLLSIIFHFLSFSLSHGLHSDGGRLVGMLTLDAWLKEIARRKQPTLDAPFEPPLQGLRRQACALCFHLLFALLLTGCITCAGATCQRLQLTGPQSGGLTNHKSPPEGGKSAVFSTSYNFRKTGE